MKRKPVVFNADDPYQLRLLNHAEAQTNFSAYIKRLIQRDMETQSTHPITEDTVWIAVSAKGATIRKT